ncbi:MAG: type IV secretory system conjugative DNA transfer family protein [Saccharofermentans sp.]|nr:type IV secretory system conjugative DNA transfer family protein [Saccharofermentans sp.]
MYLLGLVLVVWLGLKSSPYLIAEGVPGFLQNADDIFNNPFHIVLVEGSFNVALYFCLIYAVGIGIYLANDSNYRRREEHGSAKWGDPLVLNRRYSSKKQDQNIILTKDVSVGYNAHKRNGNLNIMVIGGPGSGKTRFYVKPNILNMTKDSNVSLVVLDSKGDTIRATGRYLESQGYDVRVVDLIEPSKSHCYNPFVYLKTDDDIQKLVTNIIKNTTPKGSQTQDPFWDQASSMLLKALIFYLHYEAPKEEQNFPMVMDMLRAGMVKENDDDYVSPLDVLFNELEDRNPDHIAVKSYRSYHSGAAQTLKSIQISLLARLEKFDLPSLRGMTQTDELRIDELGEKPGVIFALLPDNDKSYNFIIGMLYTQLFQSLYRCADFKHNGKLPYHVHFIMDEFANVGLPDDFEGLLSTMRSRHISVSIIIQGMAQIKALFEKSWETITADTDFLLYLGGNEQSTHEYISKMLGKETVDVDSYGESRGRQGSSSKNRQTIERDLMKPDEVARLDNGYAILRIKGEYPVIDRKFELMNHPNVKYSTDGGADQYLHGEDTNSKASISLVGDEPDVRKAAVDIEDLIGEEAKEYEVTSYDEY